MNDKSIKSLIFILMIGLSSCSTSNNNDDYEIIVPNSVMLGDFNLTDFYIVYQGKKLAINMDMIVDGSETSLYKEGTQTLTIFYNNVKKTTQINVVRRNFENVIFNDLIVSYTGETFKIEVTGSLPADVNIYYPYGNEFTNVGEYDITAILSAPYYNTLEVNAKLIIKEVADNEE